MLILLTLLLVHEIKDLLTQFVSPLIGYRNQKNKAPIGISTSHELLLSILNTQPLFYQFLQPNTPMVQRHRITFDCTLETLMLVQLKAKLAASLKATLL